MLKQLIFVLFCLSLINCLYEDSKYIKTLKWANFKKDVMESKEPWYLNFGTNNNPDCIKFAQIWEQAAQTQKDINYAWINLDTDQAIAKFFGLSGTNHQLFLVEEKPQPYGAPAFFSWPKDLKNILSFSTNELFVRKRQHIFKGTEFTQKLISKKDLETQVLASPLPWFLLFCSEQEQQDCLEIVYQFDQAAQQMKGRVKFGLVDTYKSEITSVFGINGTGVCIFLGINKPGPVGSPSLVGSQLKKKDYEKHVWDIIESGISEQTKQLTQKYSQIPEITYQQINKHDGAYVVLFYTGSETFSNDELLGQQLEAFSQVKLSEKLKIGKMSVDDNKWIINHLDIWPIPSLYFFPVSTKTAETIEQYEGELTTQAIQQWAEEELFDNLNDKQIILTRQNFEKEVMTSQDPWFIQFYTLNNNWCRKCAHLQPEWKKLSNLTDGRVNIAKLNCDIAKDICQNFKVFNFPKLMFFPKGTKSWSLDQNVDYEGAFSKNEMFQFAIDQFTIGAIQELKYLDGPQTFDQYCTKFNGMCFITVLPKEGQQADQLPRQTYINQIKSANQQLSKDPVSFLWMVDGDQPQFQERFDLCSKGYPCFVGFDHRVNKDTNGFKAFLRKFSSEELVKQIQDLLDEKRAFLPLKKDIPQIVVPTNVHKHTDL